MDTDRDPETGWTRQLEAKAHGHFPANSDICLPRVDLPDTCRTRPEHDQQCKEGADMSRMRSVSVPTDRKLLPYFSQTIVKGPN